MEEKQENIATKKKRKRVSKKSKRSWRKHTDLKDIEDHLDEVRRQERQGGVISLKENEALFFVDKDTTEDDKDTDTKNDEKKIPKKSQRSCAKVFKDFYVKPVVGRKRKIKTNKSKRLTSDESSEEEEEKTTVINNQHDEQQKPLAYDLWNSHDPKTEKTVEDQHYLKSTKKHPVKQPKSAYQVRGEAPAIAVCHPGASYNPTLEDHQSLLMTACHVEIVKEKEIQKIQRKLQLPSEEELAKLPSWEEEMSQGLFNQGESQKSADETESSDEDGGILPSGKSKSRKTAKEKRKVIERKREEQSVHILRKVKTKENDVFRVKKLKKEIRQADEKTKQRQVKKHEKSVEASKKPQRLGKHKFEEMNIEIQLTSELTGSLRSLKPEGNLFEDRYKNLQRRNIIEPRKPVVPHRKYSLKEYQKRSFKNYDLQEKLKEKRKKVGRT